jgi:hypothetical protein
MTRAQTQVDWGAFDSAIWKTRSVEVERAAKAIICWSITINVLTSMGNFNTALLAAEQGYLQQAAALSMWTVLIYASAFIRPSLRLEFNPDFAIVAFYALAAISHVLCLLSKDDGTGMAALPRDIPARVDVRHRIGIARRWCFGPGRWWLTLYLPVVDKMHASLCGVAICHVHHGWLRVPVFLLHRVRRHISL